MPLSYDLAHVINSIADPIFVKDRQHRFVLLNDACCKFIGLDRSSLIGKSDHDFFPRAEADVFWAKDELVFETGEENNNEENFTDTQGVTHSILTRKTRCVSPSGEAFIVGCISDLTERNRMQRELQTAREQLEAKVRERTSELAQMNDALSLQIEHNERTSEHLRQSQKMEAIGQLAGGIAHDFNNLLNVIIGYGTLVQNWSDTDESLQETAGHIIKAAETAASLTRQLLAFSRKQVLQAEVLEVDSMLCSVGSILRRLIGEDIELDLRAGAGVDTIKVDRGQFEQVIMNLAVNARDAMPPGGKLSIQTSNACQCREDHGVPGEYVKIEVIDTGKGMSPETQAHIFEPFFTTKEQGRGTGLGLATVYGIIAQSNGRIEVRSSLGEGSTFTIFLPKVAENAPVPIRQQIARGFQSGTGTILLVEDQRDLRTLLREVLRSTGFTVLEAASGSEALETAASCHGNIDLLITDIVMPGMRGWELAGKMARFYPAMKVLYMSGHTDTDLRSDGSLKQGDILLEKPFRPDFLITKIHEILGHSHARVS